MKAVYGVKIEDISAAATALHCGSMDSFRGINGSWTKLFRTAQEA